MRQSEKKRGRPRKIENFSSEILQQKAKEYFRSCDNRTKEVLTKQGEVETIADPRPYSIEGLCCHLGILRKVFDQWCKLDTELGFRANMVRQMIIADRIDVAACGRQNPAFAQFMLKNNAADNYRDKVEVENSVTSETAEMLNSWREKWRRME